MAAIPEEFLLLLTSRCEPTPDDVGALVASTSTSDHVRILHNVVTGVRMSSPVVEGIRTLSPREIEALAPDPTEVGGDIAAVAVVTKVGIHAEVFFTTRPDGTLGGLRMRVAEPPVDSPDGLRRQLQRLDDRAAIAVQTHELKVVDAHPKAVSSLVKVFVLESVLRAVDRGSVDLDQVHVVEARDLCERSAGLGPQHIGSRVTISELCRLMVLRSDNSATDILLERVGHESVLQVMDECGADPSLNRPLRSMRETIRAAWPSGHHREGPTPSSGVGTKGPHPAMTPAHGAGHDYYVPLGSVGQAFDMISRRDWSPWSPSGAPDGHLLYKGGSAPGVLAAAWCRGTPAAPSWIVFAVNPAEPLGALEELFAFTCAEKLLDQLGMTGTVRQAAAAAGVLR